jgi:serine/threonine-protein kinase
MELVEAATLEQRLCSGPLAPADAIKVARGMAAALHAAHAAGVVHRDLKPANVFVDDELAVKIADFGAAKLVGALGADDTQEGLTIGTPHYMSPEHAQGMPVDRRTDIYALGCVLHEMLSGAPPYDAETPREILLMHVSAAVPAPTAPSGPLPLALTRAIQRAMAKNPAERHQNGSELIADLDQATASLGRTGWRRWLP